MAMVPHCDVCGESIKRESEHWTVTITGAATNAEEAMDLCLVHRNSYVAIMREWMKFEQGFAPTWPTRPKVSS